RGVAYLHLVAAALGERGSPGSGIADGCGGTNVVIGTPVACDVAAGVPVGGGAESAARIVHGNRGRAGIGNARLCHHSHDVVYTGAGAALVFRRDVVAVDGEVIALAVEVVVDVAGQGEHSAVREGAGLRMNAALGVGARGGVGIGKAPAERSLCAADRQVG